MNNQVLMRIVNCRANCLKEFQARIEIKSMRIAKFIDRHAVDVFHDEIRTAVGQGAPVQEMRNIRMIELRQNLTFQLEARMHRYGERTTVDNFDGNLLFELSIGPLGKVNLAHPAGAQGPQYAVGPYSISHHFWSMHPNKADLQTVAGLAAGCRLRV
jgi:hypothetical protein